MPFLAYSSRQQKELWSKATDFELLEGIQREQEPAFDELIRRKAGPLMQTVVRMVGDREEARDIVQVTFLRVWEHRRRFKPNWSPNTWLYRIATNLAIDLLRSRQSRQRALRPLASLRGGEQGQRSLADLQQKEVAAIFDRLASSLTEKQRLVFLLAGVEQRSSREIAELLGCRTSTVRNHLFAARRRLRQELARLYPEYASVARSMRGDERSDP